MCMHCSYFAHRSFQPRAVTYISTPGPSKPRGPKDHVTVGILETMVSGIPLVLGLGTRLADPCVDKVFGAPIGPRRRWLFKWRLETIISTIA